MVKEECQHIDWQIPSCEVDSSDFWGGIAGDSIYGGLPEHCDIMIVWSMIPFKKDISGK